MPTTYERLNKDGLSYYTGKIKEKIDAAKAVDMTGATASADGTHGLVPQPDAGEEGYFLRGDATWAAAGDVNIIEGVQRNGTDLIPDANKKVNVEVPVLGVQRNGTDLTPDSSTKKVNVEVPVLGVQKNGTDLTPDSTTKKVNVTVPTAVSDLTNDSGYQTASDVSTAISAALGSVYKPAGDKTCAELISSLLVEGNVGKVFNITDSGTTTADFVGGAGKPIYAGDNVAIVDVGTSGSPSYKFDKLSGLVDLSGYVLKTDIPEITNAEIDAIIDNTWS